MENSEVLQIREWHTPATDYPERQIGNWRIKRIKYTPDYYPMYGLDRYLLYEVKKSIPVTLLQEKRGRKWFTWMVDDPPHWIAIQKYAEKFTGRVLCAGLGLGLIHHALAGNKNVSHIWTVELSTEVGKLVMPHLAYINRDPEIQTHFCMKGDFWDFTEGNKDHWDWIIADLWVASGLEEKLAIMNEVIARMLRLKVHNPNTKFVTHGFTDLTDVKLVDDDMVPRVTRLAKRIGLI